jgi:hypothetical protein
MIVLEILSTLLPYAEKTLKFFNKGERLKLSYDVCENDNTINFYILNEGKSDVFLCQLGLKLKTETAKLEFEIKPELPVNGKKLLVNEKATFKLDIFENSGEAEVDYLYVKTSIKIFCLKKVEGLNKSKIITGKYKTSLAIGFVDDGPEEQ